MPAAAIDNAPARLFELYARAPAESQVLIHNGRSLTYGALTQRARDVARGLAALGLRRGDRLAVMLPNGPEWFELAGACSLIGACIVSLNPRLGPKEAGDLVSRGGCRGLVASAAYRDGECLRALDGIAADARASLRFAVLCDANAGQRLAGLEASPYAQLATSDSRPDEGRADDPCLIIATSGTTSLPKLVTHAQGRVAAHVCDAAAAIGLGPDSRILLAIPMCGAFGYTVALTALAAGARIVAMQDFEAAQAGRLMQSEDITHVFGTNDMLLRILEATSGARPFPALKMFGHANFTPGLVELPADAERRGVAMRGFFGMSETLALFAAQSPQASLERRAEGGGFAVCPTARVRVRHPDDGRMLPVGEAGLLELQSPNVMIGYLDDAARTAEAFTDDGFLRTGDLARLGADGGFTFLSRLNDVLRIGGYLVSPPEIEDVIKHDEAIAACQVVAVQRPEGVRPVAFVVMKPGDVFDEAALLAHCRKALAVYKVPIRIFAIPSMPVTDGPNGAKVKKNELRDMAAALFAADKEAHP